MNANKSSKCRIIPAQAAGVVLALAIWCCLTSSAPAGLVLSKSPYSNDAKVAMRRAEQLVTENKLEEARQALRDLRIKHKDVLQGDVLLFEILASRGNMAKAKQVLEQYSVTTNPCFDIFYAFGRQAIAQQRWFDAFMHAQLALNQKMPEDWSEKFTQQMRVEAQIVLLQSCEGRGSWQQAENILATLKLDQNSDPRLLGFAGKSAFFRGKLKRARDMFVVKSSKHPSAAQPDIVMARLHNSRAEFEAADQSYLAGLEKATADPRLPAYKLEYANWLIEQNRPEDAILAVAEDDSSLASDDARLCQARAIRMAGRFDEALALLLQLREKLPESLAVLNQVALTQACQDTQAQTSAAALAKSNAEQFPGVPQVWSTLGWTQIQQGELESAEASFAKAVQTGVISRDTAYFLSELHRLADREKESAEFLSAAKDGTGAFFFAFKFSGSSVE